MSQEIQEAIVNYHEGRTANFSNKQFIKWLSSQETKIEQQADLIKVLERDNFNTEANLQAINSSLELAVKALREILECGSTGEDARDMHRIADYTLDQIRGIET